MWFGRTFNREGLDAKTRLLVTLAALTVLGAQAEMATLPSRPGWSALPAVARGRVCAFDPVRYDVLVRPGPRMGEAAAHIVECLEAISMREGR